MTKKERLKYINQDYVPSWKIEVLVDINVLDTNDSEEKAFTGINIKNSQQLKDLIIALHREGKSSREIAYHLPCSQPYIIQVISKIKRK